MNNPKGQQIHKYRFSPTIKDKAQRLDKFLKGNLKFSRSKIQRFIHEGYVKINERVIYTPHHKIKPDETIELYIPPPSGPHFKAEEIPLNIIYEDSFLLVINKPPGLIVHPVGENKTGTLVNALLYHCGEEILKIGGNERGGLVHRLDKDTSGIMVIAKDNATHEGLSCQFKRREIQKTYITVVWGLPRNNEGKIDLPLGRSVGDHKKMGVFSKKLKEAETFFEVKERFTGFVLLEAKPKTGRTHQIRVHLASIGHPIIGDPLYGGKRRIHSSSLVAIKNEINRQLLHAYKLKFYHPQQKKLVQFKAPLPPDMRKVITWARGNAK